MGYRNIPSLHTIYLGLLNENYTHLPDLSTLYFISHDVLHMFHQIIDLIRRIGDFKLNCRYLYILLI